jgi:frataxin-like iron-binding protein CyaY
MLTPQPPVRQLWVAFRDRAWHFDWDAAKGAWMDDRGLGIEVLKLVEDTTRETVGVSVKVGAATK